MKKKLKDDERPALTAFNPSEPEEVRRFADEVRSQSDRGAALVGAAFIENVLEAALKSKLTKHSSALFEKIFEQQGGALRTLSAKIDLAYALNLIEVQSYKDLGEIKHIRNEFAHSFEQLSFDRSPIRERAERLHWHEAVWAPKPPKDQRHRAMFTNTVNVLLAILMPAAREALGYEPAPSPPTPAPVTAPSDSQNPNHAPGRKPPGRRRSSPA